MARRSTSLHRTLRHPEGFTLIELIVAISIFMVLMLTATALYTTTLKTYLKDKVTQDLQREGDAILAHMSRNLKDVNNVDAANSNFTVNPNVLSVRLADNTSRKYYVSGNQLHFTDESGSTINLQSPGSTTASLTMAPTSDAASKLVSVKIRTTLRRVKYGNTINLDVGSTVSTRPQ